MNNFYDSTNKPIKVGDRVIFRGKPYTIKRFLPGKLNSCIATIQFVEDQHVTEVADEWSVDLVNEAKWLISGVVDNVDTKNGQITFWFDGFNELQMVTIAPIMPEWLFEKGASFRTKIPRAYVSQRDLTGNTSWGTFCKQENVHLSEEELLVLLAETLNKTDKNDKKLT